MLLRDVIKSAVRFILRCSRGLSSRWRNVYYRALGVNIEGRAWLRAIEIPTKWSAITLECPVALDRGVVLLIGGDEAPEKLVIHSGTYVNRYTIFDAHHKVVIGHNCMIGPHCYITDADHGTSLGQLVQLQPMQTAEVHLGDDVWLGAGVTVLPGVRIGSGTVVGAGAVVTKDLPENVIAVGIPARVLRKRTADLNPEWLAGPTACSHFHST